jgi:hypothetical protein
MSRGPGRVQREVAVLIAANADGAWTTADLCQHIYGVKTAEKKHRVAVIRALECMELPPLWKVWNRARRRAPDHSQPSKPRTRPSATPPSPFWGDGFHTWGADLICSRATASCELMANR